MIVTGIFLFLLGTKLGGSVPTPVKTEVKYEGPNKITIIEDTGDDRTLPGSIPQSGPNFIQQGSNFYFNPILPPQIVERIIPTIQNCCKNIIVTKPEDNAIDNIEDEDKGPVELDPLIEVDPINVVEDCEPEVVVPEVVVPEVVVPEVVVPEIVISEVIETVQIGDETDIPKAPVDPVIVKEPVYEVIEALPIVPEAPELPVIVIPELPLPIAPLEVVPEVSEPECDSVETEILVPVYPVIVKEPVIEVIEEITPVFIPEAPVLPPLDFPELPLQVNALPDLIVQPVLPEVSIPVLPDIEIAAPVYLQEIDVALNEIPSLPELPPLVVVEQPNVVEDKKVILIPAPAALPIEAFVPPQVVVENPVLPTICARNIVLDRVLPRIIFEQTRKIEIIPFPSARIVPVCSACKK